MGKHSIGLLEVELLIALKPEPLHRSGGKFRFLGRWFNVQAACCCGLEEELALGENSSFLLWSVRVGACFAV